MALDLTAEQKATGKENFQRVTEGLTRRDLLKSMAIAGGAVVPVSAAVYFGYKSTEGKPVKTALIGGGDEGGVLVGEHNPEFLQFIAVCDIRPSNMRRIFDGDPKVPLRKGFKKVYGGDAQHIKKYTDYREMLKKEPEIEAVVIALPLHLHAPVAVECMKIGKQRGRPIHVLCEKLMAWNIQQCKQMIRVADETGSILSIGHQRHYSMLYAHATEVLKSGVLGDIKHIRALWHRNNSWPYVDDPKGPLLAAGFSKPKLRDGWCPVILQEDAEALADVAKLKEYGYDSLEQLIRWRLYNATAGGLMAELGSHQLDACSIFLGKVKPLAVTGVGGKYFYRPGKNDRDSDDHVFVTYEFPGPNHPKGPNKGNDEDDIVVVTYSSINTNGFEAYGECVMGTRGTMIVEGEQQVMLYTEKEPGKSGPGAAKAMTTGLASSGGPALETSGTGYGPSGGATPAAAAGAAAGSGPVSRGYREEMEDFAYCIRIWNQGMESDRRLPRCHGRVAMQDAIVALCANHSMRKKERIVFKDSWFDAASDEVPDDPEAKPRVPVV